MTIHDAKPADAQPAAPATRFTVRLAAAARRIHWKQQFPLFAGILLFCTLYFCPSLSDAIDPLGQSFPLTHEGKAALALFALGAVWWGFEALPIGVTSIAVGVLQALFLIRPAKAALGDFFDPSVWFVIGSITVSMAFSRSGLTNRLAYALLAAVGERTSMIYLGSFLLTAGLTLVMAHTAVAASVFPLLMSIHALYRDSHEPTRFGKGLFIGMAFVAGAGSIISMLGSARAPVAVGYFSRMAGQEVSFFELFYRMLPLGGSMVLLTWALVMILFRPEKRTIPGLTSRVKMLSKRLGPMGHAEIASLLIVLSAVAAMGAQSFVPVLARVDKSAIILLATILLFISGVLTAKQLEEIPWNIVLLAGGAMSISFCLWETGAAKWVAIKCLTVFQHVHWLVFVMAVALFVKILANFLVNAAAIALILPVALVIAPYLGVTPEAVFFSSLATAGMPFLLLTGSAPNAIAYESRQFSPGDFFLAGAVASILLIALVSLFVFWIWPLMGMPAVCP